MGALIIWALFFLVIMAAFSVLEYRTYTKSNGVTLSHFMARVGSAFPLSLFLWGLFIGGLAAHFWWPL